MPGFNGGGLFVRAHDWTADAAAAIDIRADRMDEEDDGFAAGLSNCITKDGQTTATAVVPFASGISADTIAEQTSATGVTVDGVLLKDSQLQAPGPDAILSSISGESTSAFERIEKTTGIAQSTNTDILRFLGTDGTTLIGLQFVAGTIHLNVVDEADATNNTTAIYHIGTTGNGITNAFLDTIQMTASGATISVRGTTLVSSVSLVADGGGGAVKLRLTTAASGKTVSARACFIGMVR